MRFRRTILTVLAIFFLVAVIFAAPHVDRKKMDILKSVQETDQLGDTDGDHLSALSPEEENLETKFRVRAAIIAAFIKLKCQYPMSLPYFSDYHISNTKNTSEKEIN